MHVQDGHLSLGTLYDNNIVSFNPDGSIFALEGVTVLGDIQRHLEAIVGDRETFARLFAKTDVFEKAIPVYRYEGGTIVEDFCEEPGWPNVTHGGMLMYDTHYSSTFGKR